MAPEDESFVKEQGKQTLRLLLITLLNTVLLMALLDLPEETPPVVEVLGLLFGIVVLVLSGIWALRPNPIQPKEKKDKADAAVRNTSPLVRPEH